MPAASDSAGQRAHSIAGPGEDREARPLSLLWLQAGSCGGCSMSLLGEAPGDIAGHLRAFGIELLWHPALSEESCDDVLSLLHALESGEKRLDILCIEGAILTGPNGSGRFQLLAGSDRSMMSWVTALAAKARHLLAVGSCAAWGGIPAGGLNPVDAVGLQYEEEQEGGLLGEDYRSLSGQPVINIAGCAPHPGWVLESLGALARGELGEEALDGFRRPRFFADHLAHHGCARNEFYEYKASAEKLSDRGCLMENLGCRATRTPGDCGLRSWNGGGFCAQSGYPCIGCTMPSFGSPSGSRFETARIAGIPAGLPTDMPRAWFVALAALSKSATPERVRAAATGSGSRVPQRSGAPSAAPSGAKNRRKKA